MKSRIRLTLAALMLGVFSLAVLACTYATGNPTEPHKYGALEIVNWNRDLDGSTTGGDKIVSGIEGQPLPALAAGALSYDGGAWYFGSSGGVAPGSAGQLLATNDAGAATTWVYPHGDVDASATDPGALTVNAIQGVGVSTTSPSSTNVLAYSSGLWRPTALTTSNITPGTAGQVMVTNSSPASAWTSLISYETTHGRFTSGGSGSDYSAVLGPRVSNETTDAALWLLAHGASAGANNMVLDYNGSALLFNTPGGSDNIDFFNALSTELFHVNQSVLSLDTPPLIQWAAGVAAPTIAQATPASDVAPSNLTISAQAPYASAATNKSPGNLVFNEPAPVSTGAYGSFLFQGGGTTNASIESQFGRVTSGGGGSNFKSVIGPVVGNETADSAILLAANGVTENNSNFAVDYGALCDALSGHNHSICLNGPGSGGSYGDVTFTNANGNANSLERLGYFDGVSGVLHVSYGLDVMGNNGITWPTASAGVSINSNNASSMTVTTDVASAYLQLGGDAAANVAKLTTSFEHQTFADWDSVTTPSAPAANTHRQYTDSDGRLKVQDSLGNTVVLQ